MNKSYTTNFLKIYLWKGLSILLNMVSMFIVVPELSTRPSIYGIYMLCISTNIFLSYADIGFIGAGFKYAAEYYARGDLKNEMRIQGFVNFILAVFLVLPFSFFLIISIKPELLISDISSGKEYAVASQLLLIQAIFSFSIILKRISNTAFGIRLENHKINQILIITYTINILSIFYFFRGAHYDIVGYFLFGKILEVIGFSVIFWKAKIRFNYSIRFLLKSFRFSKEMFNKTKGLALSSFYATIMWIIYYEFDSIAITKLMGAEIFAYFAIGLTLTKFLRTFFATIYQPFQARYNHFIGVGDYNGLKQIYIKTLKIISPLVIFSVLSIVILRQPLVYSWVGSDYSQSVSIVLFLVLAHIFAIIQIPTLYLIKGLNKIKYLYIISSIMIFTYWGFILFTYNSFGVDSFAISKFISFFIANFIYFSVAFRFLNMRFMRIIKDIVLPIALPILALLILGHFTIPFLPETKSKVNFLLVIMTGGVLTFISLIIYFIISVEFRKKVISIFYSLAYISKKKVMSS